MARTNHLSPYLPVVAVRNGTADALCSYIRGGFCISMVSSPSPNHPPNPAEVRPGARIKLSIQPWLHITFVGYGLTYAKVTNKVPGSRVTMLVDKPVTVDGVETYRTVSLIQGVSRLPMWRILRGIRSHYPETRTLLHDAVEGTWLGESIMPSDKLWSRGLQMLLPLGERCAPPRIHIEGGVVDIFVQGLDGTDILETANYAEQALLGAGVLGKVTVVPEFDVLPWQHVLDLVDLVQGGPSRR